MILPGREIRHFKLLAAVFILITAAVSLYGKGAQEQNILLHADELIINKEYDEAIRILTDFIARYPDRFDEAQTRLQNIVRLRDRYNEIANELLNVLEEEPENDEKILELSDLLLTIESATNPSTRYFLDQVRLLAELNVNKRRLERIFLAGRILLEANDFSGALDTYTSGLDIYQDLYFSSGFGPEAEEVAVRGLESIDRNIRDFKALMGPLGTEAQALASGAPRPDEMEAAYSRLLPLMGELAALSNDFFDIRQSYDSQLTILQAENGVIGDRSFLSFAGRLITGPAGMNEGMTGALERFWHLRIDQVESALMNLAENSYSLGFSAMVNRSYSGALSSFDDTARYNATARDMVGVYSSFRSRSDSKSYTLYDDIVDEGKIENYLKLHTMYQSLNYLREAGALGNRDLSLGTGNFPALPSWQQGAMDAASAIAIESSIRLAYLGMIDELGILDDRIGQDTETLVLDEEQFAELLDGVEIPHVYLTDARNIVADMSERFKNQAYNSAVRQYTIANGDLEKRTLEREAEFSEGNRLIQGITQEIPGGEVYTARYPTEGLAIFIQMTANLEPDITSARVLVAQYAGEDEETIGGSEITGLQASAESLLARLLSLEAQSAEIIASARTQVELAASLRYEGDRLFQAAQAALNINDFNAARSNLERAAAQYTASRAAQESDSLRITWDTQLVRLNADIDRIENEIIVRDVRNLVTTARNQYFAGNLDQAEAALVNAQNRWRVTNVTEQPEVEYWLGLVRGALSLQSGRTIAPTAPLYAEMSQLLSEAKRNYDEGVRLLNSGRRLEGIARFDEAMGKTREVRLMFPMNHDARMLELRIEQQTDQAVFNAAYRQRLNEAIAGTRPSVRNLQSYAELQDLAEINPQYPGLRAILTQAEIDMGFRPPPPDPRDLARSTELTQSAQGNISSRDANRYALARAQLEEAIRLNPNNSQASGLLDQVSILMTGVGTIVFSYNDQLRYDEAVLMYNQGNYLRANAIVQQLLQNPDNQRSTLILELKRRIDTVL